jgi:hypothetical protein
LLSFQVEKAVVAWVAIVVNSLPLDEDRKVDVSPPFCGTKATPSCETEAKSCETKAKSSETRAKSADMGSLRELMVQAEIRLQEAGEIHKTFNETNKCSTNSIGCSSGAHGEVLAENIVLEVLAGNVKRSTSMRVADDLESLPLPAGETPSRPPLDPL